MKKLLGSLVLATLSLSAAPCHAAAIDLFQQVQGSFGSYARSDRNEVGGAGTPGVMAYQNDGQGYSVLSAGLSAPQPSLFINAYAKDQVSVGGLAIFWDTITFQSTNGGSIDWRWAFQGRRQSGGDLEATGYVYLGSEQASDASDLLQVDVSEVDGGWTGHWDLAAGQSLTLHYLAGMEIRAQPGAGGQFLTHPFSSWSFEGDVAWLSASGVFLGGDTVPPPTGTVPEPASGLLGLLALGLSGFSLRSGRGRAGLPGPAVPAAAR